MKRKNNLYRNTYKMENISEAYNEVCSHIRNRKKASNYKEYKCIYISRIYETLKNKTYEVGPYNVFTIYEPKKRRIVSQGLHDKVINHLVSREILMPSVIPCLVDGNIASRKGMGTKKGYEFMEKYTRTCNLKYGEYYILKCDISKFFASIDHDLLKEKLKRRIKDKDALDIVFKIIDSEEQGLGIGNMTSQILAIFYLNDMDHFIKEELKIKYYIRYQDDFLLFHESKEYLKYCFSEIKKFVEKEKLQLNRKSRLYKSTNNFIFLGRNKQGKYARYRDVRRRLRKRKFLYEQGKISLASLTSSLISYKYLCNRDIKI